MFEQGWNEGFNIIMSIEKKKNSLSANVKTQFYLVQECVCYVKIININIVLYRKHDSNALNEIDIYCIEHSSLFANGGGVRGWGLLGGFHHPLRVFLDYSF